MSKQHYIAIGDIHGCVNTVNKLLEKLAGYGDAQFIFVGDYIDRGPDSKGVVDRLLNFEAEHDCVFLRGNHEQMLLDAYEEGDWKIWLMNGGEVTLQSYGASKSDPKLPEAHMEFYRNTRLYHDTPDFFFVHAGLSAEQTIEAALHDEKGMDQFLWERSHLNAFETAWEKTVIFGHTPRPQPIRKTGMIGIDTGCVYDSLGYGKLTAVVLPEMEFIQQVSLDQ